MNYRTILFVSAATGLASIATAAAAENAVPAASAGATTLVISVTGDDEASAFTLPATSTAEPGLADISPETFAAVANVASGQPILNTAAIAAAQYGATEAAANGGRSDSFTVLMNQDAFFGFYPTFNGLIPVGENVDFSFYGILWTTTSFGNGGGNDLWTEFGVGAAFYSMGGNLIVKPQLGVTNGALLSRGVRDANDVPTGTGGNFADGIVPSLTINYSDDAFEAEYYGGYYAALRNRNDPGSLDFLHTWINAGAKFSDKFSAGAHYELLSNTRNVGGAEAVVYQWVGPYVQIKTDNGFFARFTAGADVEEGGDGDFYKLTAGFTF